MKKVVFCLTGFILFSVNVKANDTLKQIQKELSEVKTIQADFVEEKSLAVFNDKITIQGRICLKKPHLLSWKAKEPLKSSLIIKKNDILQWDAESNEIQKISLKKNPVFRTVIDQMQGWFYGEYSKLLKDYRLNEIQSSPPVLQFMPKETSPVSKIIEEVVVFFREDKKYIQRIEISEETGDRIVLKFSNLLLNEPIDQSVWKAKQ